MNVSIENKKVGSRDVKFIKVTNDKNFEVVFTNCGASIYSIAYPDKEGVMGIVTEACKDLERYMTFYYGKTVAPVAGRMQNATATLNGETYSFVANETVNCLHSGPADVGMKTWNYEVKVSETKAEVICLDLKTRKPVRPNLITGFDDFLYNSELENSCEKPQKLSIPDGNCSILTRPVEESDIDRNGHVNNTIYAQISVDCLNENELELPLKSFEINYINEVFSGEKINLKIFDEPDGKFILGEVLGIPSFTSKFIF
jgi:hypothetical protein